MKISFLQSLLNFLAQFSISLLSAGGIVGDNSTLEGADASVISFYASTGAIKIALLINDTKIMAKKTLNFDMMLCYIICSNEDLFVLCWI